MTHTARRPLGRLLAEIAAGLAVGVFALIAVLVGTAPDDCYKQQLEIQGGHPRSSPIDECT